MSAFQAGMVAARGPANAPQPRITMTIAVRPVAIAPAIWAPRRAYVGSSRTRNAVATSAIDVAISPQPGSVIAPIRPKPATAAAVATPAQISHIGQCRKRRPAARPTTAAVTSAAPARTEASALVARARAIAAATTAAPATVSCNDRTAVRRYGPCG
jgi:hypothetical protein